MAHQLVSQFQWDVPDHRAYSLYLALIGFHLFRELKIGLGRQRFHPNKNIVDALETYPNTLAATFYKECIRKEQLTSLLVEFTDP